MNVLSPRIMAQAERLGAVFTSPNLPEDEQRISGHFIPEAMQMFLFGFTWPENVSYYSSEESILWVWRVRLDLFDWIDPDEFPIADRGERPLVYFGETDGGNYLLALDLNDPDPPDPQVYKLDHDDPEQRLISHVRLSDFLTLLEKECG